MLGQIPLKFDERWDPDSAHIRLNAQRHLTSDEQTLLQEAVVMWGTESQSRELLRYIDEEPEAHFGEFGNWLQFYVDFGVDGFDIRTPEGRMIIRAMKDLLDRLASFELIASVWVGSLYKGEDGSYCWPFPENEE